MCEEMPDVIEGCTERNFDSLHQPSRCPFPSGHHRRSQTRLCIQSHICTLLDTCSINTNTQARDGPGQLIQSGTQCRIAAIRSPALKWLLNGCSMREQQPHRDRTTVILGWTKVSCHLLKNASRPSGRGFPQLQPMCFRQTVEEPRRAMQQVKSLLETV